MTFIFLFGNSPNSLSRGPLFGPFWSVKYFPFEQKLPIRTVHHIFLESRHPEVTKNLYYLCPLRGAKKKGISSRTTRVTDGTFRNGKRYEDKA